DFQKISCHSTVSAQKTRIVLLRAFARRQRNRDHVLGLAAVQSIELALSIIRGAKQSTASRALEIGEENPRVRVTGEECAVAVGTQCLRRGEEAMRRSASAADAPQQGQNSMCR